MRKNKNLAKTLVKYSGKNIIFELKNKLSEYEINENNKNFDSKNYSKLFKSGNKTDSNNGNFFKKNKT